MDPFGSAVAIIGAGIALGVMGQLLFQRRSEATSNKRIEVAENKAETEPEKTKPAWDVARKTLESYFNKNLNQITLIFWLSTCVMLIGFCIIVWGITQALQKPEGNLAPIVTGLAGVITEMIGATFLFIYRSTMQQAVRYAKTLERINSVGMAMQILDTIPDKADPNDLKNATKASVVRILMTQAYETSPGSEETTEASSS